MTKVPSVNYKRVVAMPARRLFGGPVGLWRKACYEQNFQHIDTVKQITNGRLNEAANQRFDSIRKR